MKIKILLNFLGKYLKKFEKLIYSISRVFLAWTFFLIFWPTVKYHRIFLFFFGLLILYVQNFVMTFFDFAKVIKVSMSLYKRYHFFFYYSPQSLFMHLPIFILLWICQFSYYCGLPLSNQQTDHLILIPSLHCTAIQNKNKIFSKSLHT